MITFLFGLFLVKYYPVFVYFFQSMQEAYAAALAKRRLETFNRELNKFIDINNAKIKQLEKQILELREESEVLQKQLDDFVLLERQSNELEQYAEIYNMILNRRRRIAYSTNLDSVEN